jgi:16S rRNA (adenine1518-N6/adenine1519-N6)-dimethyltransferase|tara:strand:- start:1373 stop:2278 length:906 start_codon:yes stop_codon:yes gene_type:complete
VLEGLDTRLLVDLLRDRMNPSKALGQHYLVDDEVIERSIRLTEEFASPLSTDSHVLEVGPGPGSLTLALLRSQSRVTAIEIDKQSVEHLDRVFRESKESLDIEEADAVSERWPEGITHIISNLPYQISSPIVDRITKYHSSEPIQLSILLVQEEFAQRMAMFSAPYDVGPLGLNLWLDFDVSMDRRVSPSSFSPSPRVQSRLVVLKPATRPEAEGTNRQLFRIITRHCFANRRRKMRTLLSKPPSRISRVSGWHRDRWKESASKLISMGHPGLEDGWADLRPENLEPEDWIKIVEAISSDG